MSEIDEKLSRIDLNALRAIVSEKLHQEVVEIKRVDWYYVFELRLADGRLVIARIGYIREEPLSSIQHIIKHHVAALDYVRSQECGVPVPEVYYVDDLGTLVGVPWILMERIPGIMFMDAYRLWRQLKPADKAIKITRATQKVAKAYAIIFELPVPDTLIHLGSDEDLQHQHQIAMPSTFDIILKYDEDAPDGSAAHQARQLRQETATHAAHFVWSWFSNRPSLDEKIRYRILAILLKLKALIPSALPTVDQYAADNGLLGARKLYHGDFSVSNILFEPETATLTGIVDWELVMAAPAVLVAAFPEWMRYDGEVNPMSDWSQRMIEASPDSYIYEAPRKTFEEAISQYSQPYVKAMHAGRRLREVVDWVQKLGHGRPLDERLDVAEQWIEAQALEYGVDLPDEAAIEEIKLLYSY